jgi:hypothetical protein
LVPQSVLVWFPQHALLLVHANAVRTGWKDDYGNTGDGSADMV